jgi:hypothetical protein
MLPMIKDRSVQIQVTRALMLSKRTVDLLTCDVVLLCQDRRRAAGGYGMDGQKHQVEACPSSPPLAEAAVLVLSTRRFARNSELIKMNFSIIQPKTTFQCRKRWLMAVRVAHITLISAFGPQTVNKEHQKVS